MFGKYNGFVSKARVSACMYLLVIGIIYIPLQKLCPSPEKPVLQTQS
jgi:hypothetical protein